MAPATLVLGLDEGFFGVNDLVVLAGALTAGLALATGAIGRLAGGDGFTAATICPSSLSFWPGKILYGALMPLIAASCRKSLPYRQAIE